jgi:regulation of enolase protein 1 (concanavalin A-like superfamily)
LNKFIAIPALSIALFGCGSGEKPKEIVKANTPNVQSAANTGAINANQAANNASQLPRESEKIEQPLEANFKDGAPKGWEMIDPEKANPSGFETKDGVLKLRIPSGKDLYGENMTAPRFLKSVKGDFEVETRVKFSPSQDYQGAGILIFRNDNNYLRLERAYGGIGGGESGIRFDKREDEIYESVAATDKFRTPAREVELKFRRVGKEFTAFWREAGKTEWVEVGKVTNSYPETVQLGLIGASTADEITAEFSFIRLLPVTK